MNDINTEELFTNIDIVDLFSYLEMKLSKIGKEYHCKCPFHQNSSDKVFSVNREKKLWYCFKCKIGGNMHKFMMLRKRCSYEKAFEYLDIFYRHAKIKKTTLEIVEFALAFMEKWESREKRKLA